MHCRMPAPGRGGREETGELGNSAVMICSVRIRPPRSGTAVAARTGSMTRPGATTFATPRHRDSGPRKRSAAAVQRQPSRAHRLFPARRRPRVPHLLHDRPWQRAGQRVPRPRHDALRPSRGVGGQPSGLARGPSGRRLASRRGTTLTRTLRSASRQKEPPAAFADDRARRACCSTRLAADRGFTIRSPLTGVFICRRRRALSRLRAAPDGNSNVTSTLSARIGRGAPISRSPWAPRMVRGISV